MKRLFSFITLILLLSSVVSCFKNREALNWDIDIAVPIAEFEFRATDMIPDSLQADYGDTLMFSFNQQIADIRLDTIVGAPDTLIRQLLNPPFDVIVAPGQQVFDIQSVETFDFGDVILDRLRIKSGKLQVKVINPVDHDIRIVYTILSSEKNGQPYSVIDTALSLQATYFTHDVSGYDILFTDLYGNKPNIIYSRIESFALHSDTGYVTILHSDTLDVTIEFDDIVIEYGKGYFGSINYDFELNTTLPDQLMSFVSGSLDIPYLNPQLQITNNYGIDAEVAIKEFNFIKDSQKQSLQYDKINQGIQIARAFDLNNHLNSISPGLSDIDFSNNNLDQIIEFLPHEVEIELDLQLNPLGNISMTNDFFYKEKGLEIDMNIDVPIEVRFDSLLYEDFIEFDIENSSLDPINSAILDVETLNGFPLSLKLSAFIYDGNHKLDTLFVNLIIDGSSIDSEGISIGEQFTNNQIVISKEIIESLGLGDMLLLKTEFQSPGTIDRLKILDHYRFNTKLKLSTEVHVEAL